MGNSFEMNDATGLAGGSILTLEEVLVELGLTLATATTQEQEVAQRAIRQAEGAIKRHLRYDPVQKVRTEYYPNMEPSLGSRAAVWETNDTEAYVRYLSDASTDELQVLSLPIREKDAEGANTIDLRLDYDGRSGTRSGSFAAETQRTEGTDFWPNYDMIDSLGNRVCTDGIIRSEGRWPAVPGSVKITYLAGYTANELAGEDDVIDASPIKDAAMNETVRRVHKRFSQMKKRTGFGTGALASESLGDYSYSADAGSLKDLTSSRHALTQESVALLQDFVNFGGMLYS
jgi:hypothetical protein